MENKVFNPENCRDCLFSEKNGVVYRCKFYKKSHLPLQGEKPPYCRVKNIVVEEGKTVLASLAVS